MDNMPPRVTRRRVIPPPFKRPSIDLTTPEEQKPEWQQLEAVFVRQGDIIAGYGVVISVSKSDDAVTIVAGDPDPSTIVTQADIPLFVFAAKNASDVRK